MTDAFETYSNFVGKYILLKLFNANLIFSFICSILNHLKLIFLYLQKQGSGFIFYKYGFSNIIY